MTDIAQQHLSDVQRIQDQMRRFYAQKKKVKIYHGSTNSTRAQKFVPGEFVDVSTLNKVMAINPGEQYIVVEPNVAMDTVVAATLKFGLVPPVVMEFPGITVGGGIQGGALESSSFRWGMFHDTCLEYEMVLGNGDVMTVSPHTHADLFWGTAGAYGSLGIITLVKLRLIPAKKYVHLAYHRVTSFAGAVDFITQAAAQPVDFIDGIMFAKNQGVIMVGNFSADEQSPLATFRRARDNWFYLHAQAITKQGISYTERIPLQDYLFRYDRGAFWMGRHGLRLLHIPFNRLTRLVLNAVCKTRAMYRLLQATNISQRYIIQDINLPRGSAVQFMEFVDQTLQIFPLWFCPVKPGQHDKLSPNFLATDLVINIGVWGKMPKAPPDFLAVNRNMEKVAQSLGGRKMLYAHAYYARKEFWNIFDARWYQALRETYHSSDVFPDIYEKTFVAEQYHPSVTRGLWRTIQSSLKFPW